MKKKLFFIVMVLSQFVLSCKKDINLSDKQFPPGKGFSHSLKVAIVSDIHYMHPSLLGPGGATGTAFQNYLAQDPKLLQYSDLVFRKVMADLLREKPDILLVPGHITKDGEKIGHQAMARFFHELRREGIQVFAMPGNHDINNAKAKKYIGDNDYPVEKTTPADFADIYADFGYKNAISRDNGSLSYVVQLQPGMRLISIDASKYEDYDQSGDVAEGRIKPTTLTWILAQLSEAKKHNQRIFAMMHHNLIEHYTGQSQLDPGYVVDDWQNIVDTLMQAGLKVIFTGHYHANDIAARTYNGNILYDIETGSLVTAPLPYRYITITNDKLEVMTKRVTSIDVNLPGGENYATYANQFLSQHLDAYFYTYLTGLYGAPPDLATFSAPLFRNGIMAHFAGDEQMPADQLALINQLSTYSQQLAGIVTTLWTDTGVPDNNTVIQY